MVEQYEKDTAARDPNYVPDDDQLVDLRHIQEYVYVYVVEGNEVTQERKLDVNVGILSSRAETNCGKTG